jgi:hypothetical protein
MFSSFCLFLLSIIPHDSVFRESFDLVEYNHFYDEYGRLVFDQVIFYDWCEDFTIPAIKEERHFETGELLVEGKDKEVVSRYNVVAWRLVKHPTQVPYRDWLLGGYSIFWQDGEQIRLVNSKNYRETWTQYDPELVERTFLPKEKRRELRSVKVRNKDERIMSR